MRSYAFLLAAALLVPCAARADERVRARLAYAHDPDIERCPSDRELRDAVAARLGYDPFVEPATRDVAVEVTRRGSGIVGQLELKGPRPGQRELASPSGDCRELIDSLAVAIAIGLDPASLTRPPGTPPPPAPPSPTPAPSPAPAPAAEPPPPAPPPPEPAQVRLSAGALGLFGEAPATTGAIALDGGVRWRALEASVEAVASLPASVNVVGGAIGGGRISSSLLAAGIVPCAHLGVAFGCAMAQVGALHAKGEDVAQPLTSTVVYAAVGVRAGIEVPLRSPFFVTVHLDGVAPLTRVTLQLGQQDVWTVPAFAARAGVGVGARF